MLLKHSVLYLFARGLPGLVNFIAISVYTRLLTPEDYGRYALVMAGVGFLDVVFFQWLRLALLRFLPSHPEGPKTVLSVVLAGFLIEALLIGGMGGLAAWLWPAPTWRPLILLAVPLLWAQAWLELNLDLVRSRLEPLRYGLYSGLKAVGALAIGTTLVQSGLGAYGPVVGMFTATSLVGLLGVRLDWVGVSVREGLSWPKLRPLLAYSAPFMANFALGFVVASSGRFMLAWLLNEGESGIYSAGYDLIWNTMGMLASIVNLAAYPLAVRAFEAGGPGVAVRQLEQNVILLLAILMPSAAGLTLLSKPITDLFLGPSFRKATLILPIVALANLAFSLKVYHADLAYQLSKKTKYQLGIAALAALTNVGLNLWWIPHMGIAGAASAALVAYTVAMLFSFLVGRRLLPVPLPLTELTKLLGATLVMVVVVGTLQGWLGGYGSLGGILVAVALGAFVYGVAVVFLDVAGVQVMVRRFLRGVVNRP